MRVREYALEQIHWILRQDPWVREIFLAAGLPLDELAERILDIAYSEDADLMLERGLARWERILGISPEPDAGPEERRAAVRMRWMARIHPSVETIQAICDAWRAGEIEAAYEASAGLIMLYFLSDWPTEGRMRELTGLLDRVKPAHLALKAGLSRTMYLYGLGYLQSCNLDIAISVPMPDGN